MKPTYEQLPLVPLEAFDFEGVNDATDSQTNDLRHEDRAFHDWYRFVLSFPPHLVRDYIEDFGLDENSTVLDPFCGTGTTIVEAKLNGITGIGLEANPFPHFASSVKIDWSIDPDVLTAGTSKIADDALAALRSQGIDDNPIFSGHGAKLRTLAPESSEILIKDSISPIPLHKTLVLLDCLRAHQENTYFKYGMLALGNALVKSIGNLRFGPEVGVGTLPSVIMAWQSPPRNTIDW